MPPNTAYYDHIQLVAAIAAVGVEAPPAWTELRQRHSDFKALQFPLRERLTAALLDPTTKEDTPTLRALVVAEQLAQTGNQASAEIEARVLHRLKQLYNAVAKTNYESVAGMFDSTATRFCQTAATVDVEAEGNTLVGKAPEKQQRAWINAAVDANRMTGLLPALAAAATLARGTDVHISNALLMLPLTVDTTAHERRELWQAWDKQDGRCRQWSSLHRLGAVIRAHPIGDEPLTEYRRPLPKELRQRQKVGAPTGVVEQFWHDPEQPTPEPFDPVRRSSGRLVAR